MTARQLQSLKRQLERKGAELEQRIRRTRQRLAIGERGDTFDQVQHAVDRELAVGDIALDLRLLEGVREALREIRVGTFGRCASCDCEIPLRRLQAVPWSPYCLQCQAGSEVRRTPYLAKAG